MTRRRTTRDARDAFHVVLDDAALALRERVGTIYRDRGPRAVVPAPFEYDPAWLASPHVFMLDPRLELWRGEQYPPASHAAFGVFLDSAPDRWGRVLMERREALASRRERRPMRALQEVDFLLGVHDLTRVGALRFRAADGGAFVDDSANAAPPVTSLHELARISQRVDEPGVEDLPEYEQWLAMLVAPGTSLGGARPKANFTDEGALWIAKFPAREDRYDVGAWEYVVHRLAKRAGIWVPASRMLELTDRYRTFCVARFDRDGTGRRMYASAMTLLERHDNDRASYLELAEFISDRGSADHIDGDLEQLFRRIVFNVLVGNRDDHLRNHGFIRDRTGWRLAPAFDLNPNPHRADHTLTFDGVDARPDLDLVLETAALYRLDTARARTIVRELRGVVGGWEREAKSHGLGKLELARMRPVLAP